MRSRHRVSRASIELIKRFEGYRRQAAQLPDGRWTIGYGHTLTARAGAEVSEADAEALLLYDLIGIAHAVNEHVFAPLTQNQFDALCSFAFNLGLENFRRSQVLKLVNEGATIQAAANMELWRKADFEGHRIVVDALVRRRAAEKTLFLTPAGDAWVPAPSPVLRPAIDLDAQILLPRQPAAELLTSLEGERVVVRREGAPPPPAAAVLDEPAAPAMTAAAESIAGRLQTIFAEPEPAPEPTMEPQPDPEAAVVAAQEDFAGAAVPDSLEPPSEDGVRPQADFAPPFSVETEPDASVTEPEPDPAAGLEPEPAPELGPEPETEPTPAPSTAAAEDTPVDTLDIPKAPPEGLIEPTAEREARERVLIDDLAPYEFIPARVQPLPKPREPSLILDLILGLLGLAFFGFGLFWGWNARAAPAGAIVTPISVAWLAGAAGVLLVVYAVYRLLQRLANASDRD